MRLFLIAAFALSVQDAFAEVPSCIGIDNKIGIELSLFLTGMKAGGLELQIDGKCGDRECRIKFDGGDGYLTADNSCVTKFFATSRWPDQKKRAALLMMGAATAIGRREPSKLSTNLMMTTTVAEDGEKISFGDPGVFEAYFNMGPYIVDLSIDSADIMTAERRQRAAEQARKEAAEKNEIDKRELLERLSRGR